MCTILTHILQRRNPSAWLLAGVSAPRHSDLSIELLECPQDTAADFPQGRWCESSRARSRSVFCDTTSEVTCHNFHRILWVTQVSPVQGGKGYRRDGHHTRSRESVEPLLGLQEGQAAQDASWDFTGEPKTKPETVAECLLLDFWLPIGESFFQRLKNKFSPCLRMLETSWCCGSNKHIYV